MLSGYLYIFLNGIPSKVAIFLHTCRVTAIYLGEKSNQEVE